VKKDGRFSISLITERIGGVLKHFWMKHFHAITWSRFMQAALQLYADMNGARTTRLIAAVRYFCQCLDTCRLWVSHKRPKMPVQRLIANLVRSGLQAIQAGRCPLNRLPVAVAHSSGVPCLRRRWPWQHERRCK
jgi:hypothetical protein